MYVKGYYLNLDVLTMEAHSSVDYQSTKHFGLEAGTLTMRYKANVQANEITVKAFAVDMEGGSYVDISGLGNGAQEVMTQQQKFRLRTH